MNLKQFKNIIFDLGGVIINLDEERTVNSLVKISKLPASAIREYIAHFEEYKNFEKGQITDQQFRAALRKELQVDATDWQIDDSMNAMLLDIPESRLSLLRSLKSSFRFFLLSNTNSIHLKRFNTILHDVTGEEEIDSYFRKAYYSHMVNMRKPDKEIFELVIDENKLIAEETLFLDDNLTNLEGAQAVGIKTFHVRNPSQLFELFV